jgi:hypothetical protein
MGVGWSLLLIAGAYMAMLVGFCGCSVTKNTPNKCERTKSPLSISIGNISQVMRSADLAA